MRVSRFSIFATIILAVIACPFTAVASQVFPKEVTASRDAPIPVTAPDQFSGCGGPVIGVVNDDYEQQVVELTNAIRMRAGLSPLKRVEGLTQSARYHAADMSNNDYFDHNTYDRVSGRLREVCDTWSRIESFYTSWVALAENIAAGQSTPEIAMDGWMNSPDHRHNILADAYSEIGVGFFEGDGEYQYYWVQNFGKSDQRFPLVIEGEKAQISHHEVDVYIYGDWDSMRLRVDQGEWSEWTDFRESFLWNLPEHPGDHQITAELRGEAGEITTSDTIRLVP